MKRILYIMTMCVFALGLLSGCGGEFAEEMEAGKDASKALTGAAVSGQAVSGQSVHTDGEVAEQEAFRKALDRSGCCSERYYYALYKMDTLVQISLENGAEKEVRVEGIYELVYIEKDALYYTKPNNDSDDYYSMWRLPIECREDGTEELKPDRAEQVEGLDDIYYEDDAIYMDDKYIAYCGENEDEDMIMTRYDRENGEKVSIPIVKESQSIMYPDVVRIYRKGDSLDIVTSDGIVTWDVGTGNVSAWGDDNLSDDQEAEDLASTERACFYMAGDNGRDIWRIDMETKKKTDFVSEKELWDLVKAKAGIQENQEPALYMEDMWYDENRLYIKAGVDYGENNKTYGRDIILSREDTEGAPLQYEAGLTEYLWEGNGKGSLKSVADDGDYICSTACCYRICHGMAGIKWEEDSGPDIVYDLKTGETRPFSWKEDMLFR